MLVSSTTELAASPLDDVLDLLIAPVGALSLQDVTKDLIRREDADNGFLALYMGQRTEFCLDHSGVMCIPGLPETTFNAEGCYIFAGVQFGKLAQLQMPRMVGLVADKVGDLLHELLLTTILRR